MKLSRTFTHVIFDLDGVLLDTEPLYTQATQAVVGVYGKVFDWSVKGEMIGRSAMEGARHLIRALELPLSPEDYLRRRKPLLDELFPAACEIPGARQLVELLQGFRLPLGLATSSERRQLELKCTRHDWFEAFEVVVCGDDPALTALKPAPDIFLTAAERLGAAPEACLVFEDSLAGVSAARAAGMQVIALPDPAMDVSRYSDADWVVSSLLELGPADLGLA